LQLGAEELAGVRVNIFHLQPLRLRLGNLLIKVVRGVFVVVRVWIVVGLVEGEPAEQQVGEQIGAADLV
jgi:hypothetical protein